MIIKTKKKYGGSRKKSKKKSIKALQKLALTVIPLNQLIKLAENDDITHYGSIARKERTKRRKDHWNIIKKFNKTIPTGVINFKTFQIMAECLKKDNINAFRKTFMLGKPWATVLDFACNNWRIFIDYTENIHKEKMNILEEAASLTYEYPHPRDEVTEVDIEKKKFWALYYTHLFTYLKILSKDPLGKETIEVKVPGKKEKKYFEFIRPVVCEEIKNKKSRSSSGSSTKSKKNKSKSSSSKSIKSSKKIISLLVLVNSGNRITFKVKLSTKMEKVFKALGNKIGKEEKDIILHFKGKEIQHKDTPKKIGLNDGDEIKLMLSSSDTQQSAGSGISKGSEESIKGHFNKGRIISILDRTNKDFWIGEDFENKKYKVPSDSVLMQYEVKNNDKFGNQFDGQVITSDILVDIRGKKPKSIIIQKNNISDKYMKNVYKCIDFYEDVIETAEKEKRRAKKKGVEPDTSKIDPDIIGVYDNDRYLSIRLKSKEKINSLKNALDLNINSLPIYLVNLYNIILKTVPNYCLRSGYTGEIQYYCY